MTDKQMVAEGELLNLFRLKLCKLNCFKLSKTYNENMYIFFSSVMFSCLSLVVCFQMDSIRQEANKKKNFILLTYCECFKIWFQRTQSSPNHSELNNTSGKKIFG